MKPIVAIVGRPNVGKSTLINRISGRRVAIVDDMPGVTRDRIFTDCEWCGKEFTLIDTGGIDDADDDITRSVKSQALDAVELSDVVLFVVDVKTGVLSGDHDIADILRRSKKPVVLVANKSDTAARENAYEFYKLGLGAPIAISAEHGSGVGDALDAVCDNFPKSELAEADENAPIKVAVVGKPNVGKSSLVNKLCGYQRSIVSNIAGTTRDAIDTPITVGGDNYILVDTAGMRRKRDIEKESVERYAVMRAIGAIKRADVVLIVIDASEELSEQDVRIAGLVHEAGKPSVIVMNKWDALGNKSQTTYTDKLDRLKTELAFMSYFTPVTTSAFSGFHVEKVLAAAKTSFANASRRITTGLLNEVISQAVAATEPNARSGRRPKIYYATQPSVCPPLFVIKVNDAKLIHFSYVRYLENTLRKAFDFSGTPIELKLVGKTKESE